MSEEKKDIMVIYHGKCDDGFCSAFLAWILYGDGITYHAGFYNDPAPDVTGKDVIIADFSYDKDTILRILDTCNSLVWLDHHASVSGLMEEIKAMNHPKATIVFDNNRSGARLMYDHLSSYSETQRDILSKYETFVNYVQDNDLWTFKSPFAKEFSVALRSNKMDFGVWENLKVENLIEEGKSMLKFFTNKVKEVTALGYEKEVFGHKVLVANCNGMFASDVGHELAKDRPFSVTWWYDGRRRKFVFSLRSSEGGADVGDLAKKAGGGGHKHAAGFQLDPEKVDEVIDLE